MRVTKKTIAAMAVIGAVGFGMLSHSEAAVAVIDTKNIAEAIKTAINTANILTNTQKQLALEIINMKKIDVNRLLEYLRRQENRQEEVWNEQQRYQGALNPQSSPAAFWNEMGGTLEDVLSGKQTVTDAVQAYHRAQKAMDKASHDAMEAAKSANDANRQILQQVQDSLKDSANAEGHLQNMQAQTAIESAGVNALIHGNQIMSATAQLEAAQFQKENFREAQEYAYLNGLKNQVTTDVTAMENAIRSPWR